jgi:hypothetical protein
LVAERPLRVEVLDMTAREKGVASTPCPNCGRGLKQVVLPDGGVSAETCPKCYGKPEKAKAASVDLPEREKGTDTEEG